MRVWFSKRELWLFSSFMLTLALLCGVIGSLGLAEGSGATAPELKALRRPSAKALAGEATEAVRDAAMREAAMGSGATAGAAWRYERIVREVVMPLAEELDELFDFEPLTGRQGRLIVVPPVAVRAGEAVRIEDPVSASGQSGSYRLLRPARLVGVIPHWRHYLLAPLEGAAKPHPSILPKTASELGRWRGWVDQGWKTGLGRAEELFIENVNHLAVDYAGMMLFRRLKARDIAIGPVTAETVSAIELAGDELVFDRRLYRLVETGRLQIPDRFEEFPIEFPE